MNKEELSEQLAAIRRMVELTRNETAGALPWLRFWGWIIITGLVATQMLIYLEAYNRIWIPWAVIYLVGSAWSAARARRSRRNDSVRTFSRRIIDHVGFSGGLACILAALVLPLIGAYNFETIPVVVSLIVGIMLFVVGAALEFNLLRIMSLVWMSAAVVLALVPWQWHIWISVVLIAGTYLLPTVLLSRRQRHDDR